MTIPITGKFVIGVWHQLTAYYHEVFQLWFLWSENILSILLFSKHPPSILVAIGQRNKYKARPHMLSEEMQTSLSKKNTGLDSVLGKNELDPKFYHLSLFFSLSQL